MRYVISLTLLLVVLWLAISGVYKPLLFILGGGSVALVVWLSLRMDVVGLEHDPVLYSWRLPIYWGWLLGQIVLANASVARRVIFPSGISPRLVTVAVPQKTAVAKVTYANSCTLTPGTVSLHLTENELTAHALDRAAAEELKSGKMASWVGWLEEGRRSPKS
ncbi:MAG: Na+/H+ antiporter subunit E [Wenzhouxiangella sp.]